MNGSDLKEARRRAGKTQKQLAKCLRVSQAYLSMLEDGRRAVPAQLQKRLRSVLELSPLTLPFHGDEDWQKLDDATLARELASLGYLGFAPLRTKPKWNPAELLVAALSKPTLEARAAEALPWLVLRYWQADWEWITAQAKLRDLQNRLGFVLTLGRELAERAGDQQTATHLQARERDLRRSLLAAETTFCRDSVTEAERRWLRTHRTPEAAEWHVLSNLKSEHLSNAL